MKKAAFCGAVALCLALIGLPAVVHAKGKNAVRIVNKSDWEIHELYLSSVEEEEWGPDQLGEQVIASDGAFILKNIPCDSYDVMLVDEDGDECVVEDVDICGGSDQWTITNKILLGCQEASP